MNIKTQRPALAATETKNKIEEISEAYSSYKNVTNCSAGSLGSISIKKLDGKSHLSFSFFQFTNLYRGSEW